MHETDDHVGDLNTGVVDVVLDFDSIAGSFQYAHKRVAQHGISHVTDVRGFVRIDAGVLDHLFRLIESASCAVFGGQRNMLSSFGAIEEDVDVTGAGDLNPRDFFDVFELCL